MRLAAFPRFRAVAEHAVLVEFDEIISAPAYDQVIRLDAAIARTGFTGFVESVPALVSLLVAFDPLLTDHPSVERCLKSMMNQSVELRSTPATHEVPVCYDPEVAPNLNAVATLTGLSADAVIAAHLSGDYRVAMYGFAPGYAYLSGLPDALYLPRKPAATRGVPAGSVIVAGAQCLVTTLTMPTGWWIIGRSPTRILRDDPKRPFLFSVGDAVRLRRISRAELDAGGVGDA